MFRNMSLTSTPTFKLILGFSLCTLGGAMLYAYFKQRDEEEETEAQRKRALDRKTSKQQSESMTTLKLVISNEHIPLLLGRTGANVSLIEERTRTKITLSDKDDTHAYCAITGMSDSVKDARALLLREIERSATIKEELLVSQGVCGKIVGRCGEMLQEICRISMAKVTVEPVNGRTDKRRVIITGSRHQVNMARKMIENNIEEDEEMRREVEEVEHNREPRRSPANSISSSMYSSQTSLNVHLPPRERLLAHRSDEKPMEVYVSAIASPSKFWVQLVGPQSKKLDNMVQAMTDYYSQADSRQLHKIKDPYVGQIVAAIFKYDSKWYRAEIVSIQPNHYNPTESVVDLYFVDYGDSEYVDINEIFELRTDFLTLRFQAVECFLANVKSTIAKANETWDSQGIQKFEEFTQVANWKKLISRVVTYKERKNTGRETSPIPGVELFDISEGVEVNIGHLLISHGYALPTDDHPRTRSPFYASSPEQLSTELPSYDEASTSSVGPVSVDDVSIEQQLQHLNPYVSTDEMYLSDDNNLTAALSSPMKFNNDYLNGNPGSNFNVATTVTSTNRNLNGNFMR